MAAFSRVAAIAAVALAALSAGCIEPDRDALPPLPEVDYTKRTLDNGLTVIVHEDHKAPLVAVNIWYHVGSKDEPAGRTGFAHLFEHLMFQGSEHYEGEFFRPFERAGATDMNGTTGRDRTQYFETVPRPALDMALWMESDRMGHLLGGMTRAKLDEQRGVVKNEKRQRENQPYGEVWQRISRSTYPPGHPYHHPVIGSMEDLEAADLEDVRDWFREHYGAANAVLVIAGDIDTETAFDEAREYFGWIRPGPPQRRPARWIARAGEPRREVMHDRVAQARLYRVWNVPQWGRPEVEYLQLAAEALAGDKRSPLYRRLVYDGQLATDVHASVVTREIGSQLIIRASAREGVPLEEVEAALEEELTAFRREGPGPQALERARTAILSGAIRGLEKVGGFGGKAGVLAEGEVYGGDPDAWREQLARVRDAGAQAVRGAVREWLGENAFTLEVRPYPEHEAGEDAVDRGSVPGPGKPADLDLPALERATLDNGLEIVLARRPEAPVMNFRMIFDAGYAADAGDRPGLASLTMSMLDEGTAERDALEISAAKRRLGARIGVDTGLDTATVRLSALPARLEESLELYAEIIRQPTFPKDDLERRKRQRQAAIEQEKTDPMSLALRTLPPLLYGDDHAYSQPLTGSGTQASVKAMTAEGLADFHERWLRPDNATLVVVGDTDMASLRPRIERAFGDWRAPDEAAPDKRVAAVEPPAQPRVYLLDRPGSQQSLVLAGQLAPPRGSEGDIALRAVNSILGGMFTSRLNMNLREAKNWAYGASSALVDARGPRPLISFASVQQDRVAPAIREMRGELAGIRGGQPIREQELAKARDSLTRSLPGNNETGGEIAGSVAEIVTYGLPDDYYDRFVDRVLALEQHEVQAAAKRLIRPDQLVWVVVGDLDRIEADVRGLDLGPVQVLDTDGRSTADGSGEAGG